VPEAKTVALDEDRSLHALTAGAGADVVLIHGALNTSADWLAGPFQALAAEGVRVTAIDRPGCGQSRRRRFEAGPRAQAEQIHAGLLRLKVERPVLVAHSFGGMVALAFAEMFPEAVTHLVLVAPLAFPESRPLEHGFLLPRSAPVLGPLLSGIADATIDLPMLKLFQKLMFSPQEVPELWERHYPYAEMLTAEAMVAQGEDAATILPFAPAGLIDVRRIETPTHILHGIADKVVRSEIHGRPLARLMPNARLTEIEGVGHMPHQVRTDLLVEAVRQALVPA
jgi:pimeloyl-ACP methyl ester carboxylesterase